MKLITDFYLLVKQAVRATSQIVPVMTIVSMVRVMPVVVIMPKVGDWPSDRNDDPGLCLSESAHQSALLLF